MSISKKIFYNAVAALPISVLKRASGIKTLFPYHHTVSDHPLEHIRHLYSYKNSTQFEKDLDYLLRNFNPVSVADLEAAMQSGRPLKKGGFLLTFDDGFREVAEIIAPMLKSKGVPAIFFINPAFIDNKELFYRCKISMLIGAIKSRKWSTPTLQEFTSILKLPISATSDELVHQLKQIDQTNAALLNQLAPIVDIDFNAYLEKQQPFLRSEQLDELVKSGFSVGGHSWDHPYYRLLSLQDQVTQTGRSVDFLQKRYGMASSLFSFPHDDRAVDSSYFQVMEQSGQAPALYFGIQNQLREEKNRVLHRFNAERPDLPIDQLVKGILALDIVRGWMGKNQVYRK